MRTQGERSLEDGHLDTSTSEKISVLSCDDESLSPADLARSNSSTPAEVVGCAPAPASKAAMPSGPTSILDKGCADL